MSSPAPTQVVLVADDSAVARLAIMRRLRAEGLGVVECDSVQSARTVATGALACAILDLDLGDGNGVEVALLLHAKTPALPVAFFSGGAEEGVVARARKLGPIFEKPDGLEEAIAWAIAQAT